ncbi:hypothetical protein H5410_001278 [Solanum commersonii]|uniref:Uncharacterized protein n=1 Tax=Solanum commersonii TaxID=4109 RepID=A0A9J6AYR9_SOLCO|nr:hypothetical protein H5410_001278 [Solanum commersonii]
MGMEDAKFFTFIQPVFELLPKLLKQSRLELVVTNDTKAPCRLYSITFIEHLITKTTIQPPQNLLCDNTIGRMQWIWVAGIEKKKAQGLAAKTNNVQKEEEDEENGKKGKQASKNEEEEEEYGGRWGGNLLFLLLIQLAGGFPPVLVPTKIG